MKIDDFPPGLISRRAFPIDMGRIVVEETWDIDVPGCLMIRSPWHPPPLQSGSMFVRQVVMTEREYEASAPPLK